MCVGRISGGQKDSDKKKDGQGKQGGAVGSPPESHCQRGYPAAAASWASPADTSAMPLGGQCMQEGPPVEEVHTIQEVFARAVGAQGQ